MGTHGRSGLALLSLLLLATAIAALGRHAVDPAPVPDVAPVEHAAPPEARDSWVLVDSR